MKRWMPWMIGSLTLIAVATGAPGAEQMLPGQADFGAFSPPNGDAEFVEVNVPASVIALAAKLVEKDQPDVSKVLSGLKLVKVDVIGLDDENRAEMQKRAQQIRKDLAAKGWERLVTAKKKGQDASVYLKLGQQGAVEGLAAVVLDDTEHAVFANIVGDIKPEQLAMVGEKFHIDPLKKLGLKHGKAEREDKEKADE